MIVVFYAGLENSSVSPQVRSLSKTTRTLQRSLSIINCAFCFTTHASLKYQRMENKMHSGCCHKTIHVTKLYLFFSKLSFAERLQNSRNTERYS